MRLTKAACEALAAMPKGEVEGRPTFWDEQIPGFGARLNSPGHVSFVLRYRVKGEKRQRLVTLGDFPSTRAERARDEASQIKSAARLGRNLLGERQAEQERLEAERDAKARGSLPVADLLDAWRASVVAAMTAREAQGIVPRYERELLRIERATLRPAIGADTVASLDPRRFQALIRSLVSPSNARNLRAALVRFITWANDRMTLQGVGVEWPTGFKVHGRSIPREHRFDLDEAARIWVAAGALGRRGALIRWMLLTGCRRSEAQTVQWSHIVHEDPVRGAHWQQPPRLTKNRQAHRVPLSPPAVALLGWLPPRKTEAGPSPLIFAGRGGKLVGDWTLIRRLLMDGAGVTEGTLHDFRRTIVSALGDLGFDPQVADALLNHSTAATLSGVMAVYQRSELWVKRRAAIEAWTDALMEAVARQHGKPVGQATWGFDEPFEEVRLLRPAADKKKAALPKRQAPPARVGKAC